MTSPSTARCAHRSLWGLREKPGRIALALFRMPLRVYRDHPERMPGRTFVKFVHTGRKTGQLYETVAMVLRYDQDVHEAVICAAWGPETDWVRNLQVGPAASVQLGHESFAPQHRFLSQQEAFDVALQFRRQHPGRLRLLGAVLGWGNLKDDQGLRSFVRTHPFVAFRPITATG